MFVVVAEYYVHAGKDDEVAAILEEMIPLTRAEPGCAAYIVNRSVEDRRKFLLYEQYHSRAGFDAHTTAPYFKEHILGRAVPLLESRVRHIYDLVEPA